MKFTIKLILSFILVLCRIYAVHAQDPGKDQKQTDKIDFKVDGERIYDATNVDKNNFVFSPLEKNKIWTVNCYPYELDLNNGKWIKLSEKLNDWAGNNFRSENIYPDPYQKDIVWFSSFYKGVMSYDLSRKKIDTFSTKSITAFLALKNQIILGTFEGLYFFMRKNESVIKINKVSEIWVMDLRPVDKDNIVINNAFVFNINTRKIYRAL